MMFGKDSRLRGVKIAVLVAAALALGQPIVAQGLREQDVKREWGYITLRDGVKLSYVTYRPLKEGRYPVLLEFSPYGVDGTPFNDAVRQYLNRGYAYAGVDIRGTSCSTGAFTMFDPLIAQDGAEAIDWIGNQPWANGVGMIGNSYPGHTQIFVASARPKHLKAIAAGATTASTYREVWRPAGMFNHAFIGGWAFSDRDEAAKRRAEWGDTQCDLAKAKIYTRNTYYEVMQHPVLDDWWQNRDPENYVGRIEVPTLLVQAWQDHQTQISGPLRLFRELKSKDKRILLQPGGHGVYRRPASVEHWMRFLDHYLKGEDNGVDKEPQVKVLWEVRDVDGTPTPNWATTYPSWPPPNARPMTLYLTAEGKLSPEKPSTVSGNGPRSYTYPVGTELVADNDQFAIRPLPTGVLTYRTAPMADDTTILGFSQFTFYMSSEQKDTDVMVVLHDIDENGNTLYLTRDFLRASLRGIDQKRSNAEETVRAFNKVEPLTPGQIYEMKLSIPPLGHVLRKGHSLELAIMAPSHIGQPNWGFMILDLPGRNTVYHSAQYPSSLTLSVLPGERAQALAPACGVMERQPCRKAPPQTASR
jgi:putative CocE/NonD family hydrolase